MVKKLSMTYLLFESQNEFHKKSSFAILKDAYSPKEKKDERRQEIKGKSDNRYDVLAQCK